MTTKTHAIGQVLATLLQILNMVSGIVPPKYQPWVMFGLSIVQAGMGLYSHYYNPDGTPASVAYVAKVLLLFLLFGGVAMAQTPAPEPTPVFSISQQAVGIRIGGQTVAGSDTIGAYTLMDNSKVGMLQLQSDNILAPSINLQSYLGGVKSYPAFFANLFAKTNLNVAPYFHAAFGIVRNVPAIGPTQQHYSVLAGTGFDWKANSTLSLGPNIEYLNAPGFGPHPHGVKVSANLTIVLGKK